MFDCLEPVHLHELSAIRARFFRARSPRAGGDILVIRYEGTCRPGEDGAADGRFLLALAQAGLTAWEPEGFVLDLSGLDCPELGEGLSELLALGEGFLGGVNLPQAVVAGPGCEQAIGTYFLTLNAHCKDEAKCVWHRDLAGALAEVEEEAAKWRAKFGGPPYTPPLSKGGVFPYDPQRT